MFTKSAQLYLSDNPLGEKTTWVAFPVLISVSDQSFASSLQSARQLYTEFHGLGQTLTTESVNVGSSPNADEAVPETAAHFIRSGKDKITEIYTSLFVKFDVTKPLWEKLASVTKAMDAIEAFMESMKPRKNVKIEAGIRFEGK